MNRRIWPGRALAVAGILAAALGLARAADGPHAIHVDQIGYRPGDPKVAYAVGAMNPLFSVRRTDTKQEVFEGTAWPSAQRDSASGDQVAALDLPWERAEGEYVVTTADGLSSPSFRIGPTVYDQVFRAALKSFTYQRCGAPITDGSPFARPACHLNDAREWGPGGKQRVVTGGWHDAGDYGKYVVPAGITVWHLAIVASLLPSTARAEVLDEMRWELDWLLRMQR